MQLDEKNFFIREKIKKIREQVNRNQLDTEVGYDCCKTLLKNVNKQNLEAGKYETVAKMCQETLEFLEDESIRVTAVLCLQKMGLQKQAKRSIEEGLKIYPDNKIFLKYQKEIRQNIPESEKITLLSSKNTKESTNLNILNEQKDINRPIGQNISPDHLKMMENMDDEQLKSMLNMAKNMKLKDQFKQVHGKELGDEEMSKMEAFLTPENFKMALNMMKSNPGLLNQMTNQMGSGISPQNQIGNPFLNELNGNKIKNDENLQPNLIENQTSNFPMSQTESGSPISMDSLLQNKDTIKTAMKMMKDNPKMMIDMLSGMTNNPQMKAIAQISERKLKILANFLYYSIIFVIEIVSAFKKYKGQLIFLMVALFIYKFLI